MRESQLLKQALVEKIESNRRYLRREFHELKESVSWTRTLTGSLLNLVSRRPFGWKGWMRILPLLPVASTLLNLFIGKRKKSRRLKRD